MHGMEGRGENDEKKGEKEEEERDLRHISFRNLVRPQFCPPQLSHKHANHKKIEKLRSTDSGSQVRTLEGL